MDAVGFSVAAVAAGDLDFRPGDRVSVRRRGPHHPVFSSNRNAHGRSPIRSAPQHRRRGGARARPARAAHSVVGRQRLDPRRARPRAGQGRDPIRRRRQAGHAADRVDLPRAESSARSPPPTCSVRSASATRRCGALSDADDPRALHRDAGLACRRRVVLRQLDAGAVALGRADQGVARQGGRGAGADARLRDLGKIPDHPRRAAGRRAGAHVQMPGDRAAARLRRRAAGVAAARATSSPSRARPGRTTSRPMSIPAAPPARPSWCSSPIAASATSSGPTRW